MRALDPTSSVNLLVRFDQTGSPDDVVSTVWVDPLTSSGASSYARVNPIFGGARWQEAGLLHESIVTSVLPAAAAARELVLNASAEQREQWGMRSDRSIDRQRIYDFTTNTNEGEYDLVIEVEGPARVSVHGEIARAPVEVRALLQALLAARA